MESWLCGRHASTPRARFETQHHAPVGLLLALPTMWSKHEFKHLLLERAVAGIDENLDGTAVRGETGVHDDN